MQLPTIGNTPPTLRGVCHVDNCNMDLTQLRDYHQRFKICDNHLKVRAAVARVVIECARLGWCPMSHITCVVGRGLLRSALMTCCCRLTIGPSSIHGLAALNHGHDTLLIAWYEPRVRCTVLFKQPRLV